MILELGTTAIVCFVLGAIFGQKLLTHVLDWGHHLLSGPTTGVKK